MDELMIGLRAYMNIYNEERMQQSLVYGTPEHVYRTGVGGSAMIVVKFGGVAEPSVARSSTQESCIVEETSTTRQQRSCK
jgi:hypothetical protein